jgi:hypothetical protein
VALVPSLTELLGTMKVFNQRQHLMQSLCTFMQQEEPQGGTQDPQGEGGGEPNLPGIECRTLFSAFFSCYLFLFLSIRFL